MTIARYSRVQGLKGEVTADVRRATPSFNDREQVVAVEATDCELRITDWDKLVAEVNQLLGRDEGSAETAAAGS